jgi:hypothetical protein
MMRNLKVAATRNDLSGRIATHHSGTRNDRKKVFQQAVRGKQLNQKMHL